MKEVLLTALVWLGWAVAVYFGLQLLEGEELTKSRNVERTEILESPARNVPDRGGPTHYYQGPPPGRLYSWERADGAQCLAWMHDTGNKVMRMKRQQRGSRAMSTDDRERRPGRNWIACDVQYKGTAPSGKAIRVVTAFDTEVWLPVSQIRDGVDGLRPGEHVQLHVREWLADAEGLH